MTSDILLGLAVYRETLENNYMLCFYLLYLLCTLAFAHNRKHKMTFKLHTNTIKNFDTDIVIGQNNYKT